MNDALMLAEEINLTILVCFFLFFFTVPPLITAGKGLCIFSHSSHATLLPQHTNDKQLLYLKFITIFEIYFLKHIFSTGERNKKKKNSVICLNHSCLQSLIRDSDVTPGSLKAECWIWECAYFPQKEIMQAETLAMPWHYMCMVAF